MQLNKKKKMRSTYHNFFLMYLGPLKTNIMLNRFSVDRILKYEFWTFFCRFGRCILILFNIIRVRIDDRFD